MPPVDDTHLLGGITRLAPVLARLELPDLPGAVHLVAEAPVLDAVRLLVAVGAPQVAPAGAARKVAVLDVGQRGLDAARAEVHAEQRLRADQPAPVDELVGPELVGFERVPCAIHDRRTLGLRAHAVEPVVARHEVPARVADDRHAQLLDLASHVRPEPLGVGERRAWLVDARVDGPSEVLEERAQYTTIEVGPARSRPDERARWPTGLRVADGLEPRPRRHQRAGAAQAGQEGAAIDCRLAVRCAFRVACVPATPAVHRSHRSLQRPTSVSPCVSSRGACALRHPGRRPSGRRRRRPSSRSARA